MAICVNCGRQIKDGARFCGICGQVQPTEDDLAALGVRAEETGQAPSDACTADGPPPVPAASNHTRPARAVPDHVAAKPESRYEDASPSAWHARDALHDPGDDARLDGFDVAEVGVDGHYRMDAPAAWSDTGDWDESTVHDGFEAPADDADPGDAEERSDKMRRIPLLVLIAVLSGLIVGSGLLLFVLVSRKHAGSDVATVSALPEDHCLVIDLRVPGLDDQGSRVPVRVVGIGEDNADFSQDAYVGPDGTSLQLQRGSYEMQVLGSPIAGDGTLYAYDGVKATVQVGQQDDDAAAPVLELVPLDASEVTSERIDAAVQWVRDDEERSERADALAKAAEQAMSAANVGEIRAAAADAFATALDDPHVVLAPNDDSRGYGYALADMTGDGVPEMLLGVWLSPSDLEYRVLTYDRASDAAVRVGDALRYDTFKETLSSYADGHALLYVGSYGSKLFLQDITVSDGALAYTDLGQFGSADAPSAESLGATPIEFVDASDRAALDALRES